MATATDSHQASRNSHAVRFYEDAASLCRTVANFLSEGLALGHPALVIATPQHRDALLAEFRSREVDVGAAQTTGDLELLDARHVLASVMIDGMPDAPLFNEQLATAIGRLSRGRKDRVVRAYGELVDVLWQDGLTAAAIRLEMLWNLLANRHDFSLLCGYAMGSFYTDGSMRTICAQHSHVIPAESALKDVTPTSPSLGRRRR